MNMPHRSAGSAYCEGRDLRSRKWNQTSRSAADVPVRKQKKSQATRCSTTGITGYRYADHKLIRQSGTYPAFRRKASYAL